MASNHLIKPPIIPGQTIPDLSTQYFTVRLWRENLGGEEFEWRGRVEHVLSGEGRYFREWLTLEEFLVEHSSHPSGDSGIEEL